MTTAPPVAIIGAGMAGLSLARAMAQRRRWVHLYDKARGPGGRLACYRDETGTIDQGALAFRADHHLFQETVTAWERLGLVASWQPRQATLARGTHAHVQVPSSRWVGLPRMSALSRALAEGLDLRRGSAVTAIAGSPGAWELRLADGSTSPDRYAQVVLAVPAPQAVPLLAAAPEMAATAGHARYAPTWTVLLRLEHEPELRWDEALCEDAVLHRIVREAAKPGRDPAQCAWVLHAQQAWSAEHLEQTPEAILPQMIAATEAVLGQPLPPRRFALAHRWRFAHVTRALGAPFLWDPALGLGACGDWCLLGNVEGAWMSGQSLALML